MATDFKLRYSGSVSPLEVVTLSDGVDAVRVINSNIDKSLSSTIEKSYGSVSTEIKYKASYLTTITGVALSHSSILNSSADMGFLFIKISSAGSSGTPECYVSLDGGSTYRIRLLGTGDFCIIPFDLDAQMPPQTSDCYVKSGSATTAAYIEVLTGK